MIKRDNITKTLTMAIIIFSILAMASVSMAQQVWTTKKGYIASLSKADIKDAMNYAAAKDQQAFNSLINQNRVMNLKPGVKVYLEETSWGYIKIRPVGTTIKVWTLMEAIEE